MAYMHVWRTYALDLRSDVIIEEKVSHHRLQFATGEESARARVFT
jgi:hypothetical protein